MYSNLAPPTAPLLLSNPYVAEGHEECRTALRCCEHLAASTWKEPKSETFKISHFLGDERSGEPFFKSRFTSDKTFNY